jgi:hypothetical protein
MPSLASQSRILRINIREGNREAIFCSSHYWVGNRRSGLNVGIGISLHGPRS